MRWDNLKIEAEEGTRLPGYADAAVVRRFDAPEALETRFYEVRAKSALNRVPEASAMPFRWTINPYRGCSHACSYCCWSQTPVLMADGSERRIEQLAVGDQIIGTELRGAERVLVRTEIVDHWATTKPAHRVDLADGRTLVASADHRFLSVDGWNYVADDGHGGRPALARGSQLIVVEEGSLRPSSGAVVASIGDADRPETLYDITTGTGDFIANGVVSHNCFARPTHKYLHFNAGRDFEKEIVVKVNVPELLRAELKRPAWKREHIAMGTNTDPYQWVEGRYKLMPGIWEALRDFRNPCSVLTKSPLLLRDLALMKEIAEVTDISANLSIPTMEEKAWRASEPHTPNPRARMEAVAELNRNGIPTGILIAPLMPGINDDPRQVEEILQLAADAGAKSVGGIGLHLRGEVRSVFMDWLASYRPDLLEHYERLYARGAYLPKAERERLSALLSGARTRRMGAFRRDPADARPVDRSRRMPVEPPRQRTAPAAPAAVQEPLF